MANDSIREFLRFLYQFEILKNTFNKYRKGSNFLEELYTKYTLDKECELLEPKVVEFHKEHKAESINSETLPLVHDPQKPTIMVHIGFGHTGTTSLQETYFPAHRHIKYLGNPRMSPEISKSYDNIANLDSALFQHVKDDITKHFCASIEDPKMLHVISGESFATQTWIGTVVVGADRRLIAQRVREVLSDNFNVKILITLRNQVSYLRSVYFQYKNQYTKMFKCTMQSMDRWVVPQLHYLNIGRTEVHDAIYYFLAIEYASIFGKENVLLQPLEILIENKRAYFERLNEFMGIPFCEHAFSQMGHHNKAVNVGEFSEPIKGVLRKLYNPYNQEMTSMFNLDQESMERYKYISK